MERLDMVRVRFSPSQIKQIEGPLERIFANFGLDLSENPSLFNGQVQFTDLTVNAIVGLEYVQKRCALPRKTRK